MSVVMHSQSEVLSIRHGVSWALLALAAGAVNAGAFIASGRFVSHVTGIVTNVGLDVGLWALMAEYGLVLVSFIGGAMASVLLLQGRAYRGKRPLHAVALGLVAVVLAAAAIAGHFGVFGVSGGQVEETTDFALLCTLAFAMGLMNASVASSTALAVRTTHATGPLTDFGVHLATAWLTTGEERKKSLQLAALRGSKVAAFGMGAALMVPAMKTLGFLAFALPAFIVLVATARSFAPHALDVPLVVMPAPQKKGMH